jgi:hypothetical protein
MVYSANFVFYFLFLLLVILFSCNFHVVTVSFSDSICVSVTNLCCFFRIPQNYKAIRNFNLLLLCNLYVT